MIMSMVFVRCICMYVCVYICMCICVYVHIYIYLKYTWFIKRLSTSFANNIISVLRYNIQKITINQ